MNGLHRDEHDGALWLTLDRPPVNVLDIPTIQQLEAALAPLASRADLRAVVLRSALPGTFSAGVDIRDHSRERVAAMLEAFHRVFRLLNTLPQVTLAAVNGRCLGGGCELAVFCDFVLAAPEATFGQPEIDVGCFPPVAAALLPLIAGRGAAELVLLGSTCTADEAQRMGLVTRVAADLPGETAALVARLAAKSASVLAVARKALRQASHGGFEERLSRMERLYRDELLATEDVEEGVRAFLEKRPARWRHR